MDAKMGHYAFMLGVLLAILGAFLTMPWLNLLLVLLGLVVGFLNVKASEANSFLLGAVALLLTSNADFSSIDSVVGGVGTALNAIMANLAVFVAPAALVVAVMVVAALAKD